MGEKWLDRLQRIRFVEFFITSIILFTYGVFLLYALRFHNTHDDFSVSVIFVPQLKAYDSIVSFYRCWEIWEECRGRFLVGNMERSSLPRWMEVIITTFIIAFIKLCPPLIASLLSDYNSSLVIIIASNLLQQQLGKDREECREAGKVRHRGCWVVWEMVHTTSTLLCS